jgi:hypothetical protein
MRIQENIEEGHNDPEPADERNPNGILLWLVVQLKYKSKCKAIPLQAWTGPEGSRKLRVPDFKTIGTWR